MCRPPRPWPLPPSRLCELFRAYTVRSERASIFRIGVFSNKWMQYAVGVSLLLLFLVTSVPFLQPSL